MDFDIIAIGSATQDVFLTSDSFRVVTDASFDAGQGICLPFGSKVGVSRVVFASGGGGTNAAVTFARQGYRTACIAAVGRDHNAPAILDELRREGVDAKHFQTDGADITEYSVILVGAGGERTILVYRGKTELDARRIPWDSLRAKWMYVDSVGSLDVLESVVTWAKKTGTHLATNPGGREIELGLAALAQFWKDFDIVGVNQEEAARLTGIPYNEEDAIFRKMDDAIGGIFIMTKGRHGVLVSDGHFVYSADIPNQEVVERTGAGDAFHSGFLAEYMRTGNIEKAVQFGTANASSVVMQFGAKAGILTKGESGQWPLVAVAKRPLPKN
ncbi:MAG TPA: carbohydrate kinase family protein [Candidatus Paceibacterota bacterium]|nr:carbohydrate kinase family protein [Candidatus Paceibacterota bacterium]